MIFCQLCSVRAIELHEVKICWGPPMSRFSGISHTDLITIEVCDECIDMIKKSSEEKS